MKAREVTNLMPTESQIDAGGGDTNCNTDSSDDGEYSSRYAGDNESSQRAYIAGTKLGGGSGNEQGDGNDDLGKSEVTELGQ